MKQFLLLTSFIFCAMIGSAQIAPSGSEPSPNIAKTSYIQTLNGKVMQAYPNPAIDQVTVQHVSSANRAVIYLITMEGRVLLQQNVIPNSLQTNINVRGLTKGIYMLKYDDTKGDVRTIRLIKS